MPFHDNADIRAGIKKIESRRAKKVPNAVKTPKSRIIVRYEPNIKDVNPPISDENIQNLKYFSRWLFGDEENSAVVTDSRQVDKFARVLASEEGIDYLRTVKRPNLEQAFLIAGGTEEELYDLISEAAYNVGEALSSIHRYTEDDKLKRIVERLSENVVQLNKVFGL